MRTGFNDITLEAYSSGLTRIADPGSELTRAQGIQFSTGYPGGLFLDAGSYVPRSLVEWWALNGAQRIVLRNGLKTVYEGYVDGLSHLLDYAGEGIQVPLIGAWGFYLMRRRWRKYWADTRFTEDAWPVLLGNQEDMFSVDRQGRLLFLPKDGLTYANGHKIHLQYTMPTGETIKRIVFTYDLTSAGDQDWTLALWNSAAGAADWSVSRTTTGSSTGVGQDVTLSTPSQSASFYLQSDASQSGVGDGSIYGKITALTVYSETGSINAQEVGKDVRAELTALNAAETNIGALTLGLAPFVVESWETMADILTSAADYGDASFNRWAFYLRESEFAASPDGKPLLCLEQQPALTDYDYAVSLDESGLEPGVNLLQDFGDIWNWVIVEYQDSQGKTQYLTPDDDSDLKDDTSITNYGQRDMVISIGPATSAMAENAGRRFLAAKKDPQWRATSPIGVRGAIRAKGGNLIPASEIRAGKRVKIENFLRDLSGAGLTLPISGTTYDDESEVCAISTGQLDDILAQRFFFPTVEGAMPGTERALSGGEAGERSRLNWKRRIGLEPGTPEWERAKNASPPEKKAMLEEYRRRKRG